jgi:hypothetical protein
LAAVLSKAAWNRQVSLGSNANPDMKSLNRRTRNSLASIPPAAASRSMWVNRTWRLKPRLASKRSSGVRKTMPRPSTYWIVGLAGGEAAVETSWELANRAAKNPTQVQAIRTGAVRLMRSSPFRGGS